MDYSFGFAVLALTFVIVLLSFPLVFDVIADFQSFGFVRNLLVGSSGVVEWTEFEFSGSCLFVSCPYSSCSPFVVCPPYRFVKSPDF